MMKLKEAKEIVSTILDWQFVLMGVKERDTVSINKDLEKYSLEDLIKANKLVNANNKRKESLQKYYREKNGKANSISISMILADRLIASVYTSLHFQPDGEMIALINDVGCGCVKANYNE